MITFASDLKTPEGPVALSDGSFLVVEGGRGSVTQIAADGRSTRIIAVTGEPNGLAVDKAGTIWVADIRPPALIRLNMDGKFERVLTGCQGEPFLFPNDLCFGPDGALYLTDSGILTDEFAPGGVIRPDWATLKMDGRVYRIDTRTLEIQKLDAGLKFVNGIAFSADQFLYINDTVTRMVYRYPWKGGKLTGSRQDFGSVDDPKKPALFKGPDGMAFDVNGKLYVAVYAQGDVTVLGKTGKVIERIQTPGNLPTNVCFGLGQKKIYVTEYELGRLECFNVDAEGLSLWG